MSKTACLELAINPWMAPGVYLLRGHCLFIWDQAENRCSPRVCFRI